MIELVAPAKLTLSLRITGLRDDGYHLIDAEMVALDLADRLKVEEGSEGREFVEQDPTTSSTLGGGDDNLVAKALRLANRRAFVRLHKRIPAGAGLGGGSADAAAILR